VWETASAVPRARWVASLAGRAFSRVVRYRVPEGSRRFIHGSVDWGIVGGRLGAPCAGSVAVSG